MENLETRLYLFTGFLESGKTSFGIETLLETDFCENEKTVYVLTEQGEVEIDFEAFKKVNTDIVIVESDETIQDETFWINLKEKYQPTQVVIEYNGMWEVSKIMNAPYPKNWDIVQIITTIDATKFSFYVNNANMRSYLYEHCKDSDLIIFNRTDGIKKSFMRNNIKAINPRAQIIYEKNDRTIDQNVETELPFDKSQSYLDIADHDFGIFCYDMMEHPEDYANKKIRIKGKFIGKDKVRKDGFILGRYAMVCCEQDTSLIGMLCVNKDCDKFIPNEWLIVEGHTTLDYDEEMGINIITLHTDKIEGTTPLDYEYVTFD